MQLDDDVFLHVHNIYKIKAWVDENCITGYVYKNVKPIRWAHSKDPEELYKWICPKWMYAQKTYPDYTAGPAYVIPTKHVECLYQMALKSSTKFYMEDIFITGMLREKCDIKLKWVYFKYMTIFFFFIWLKNTEIV